MTRINLKVLRFACVLAYIIVVIGNVTAEDPEKLVSGTNAYDGEFPYMVSIRKKNQHVCCGALISSTHVLTAAHCVAPFIHVAPGVMTVMTGSNQLYEGGQISQIQYMMYHPSYVIGQRTWNNDIGGIKLQHPIIPSVRQTWIPVTGISHGPNIIAMSSAWGATGFPPKVISPMLQKIPFRVMSTPDCQKYHSNCNDMHICGFAAPGVGTCSGDSGSPLVHKGAIIGVVSGGIPCARGYPDIWTNVSHFTPWIQQFKSI